MAGKGILGERLLDFVVNSHVPAAQTKARDAGIFPIGHSIVAHLPPCSILY